jgi:hypothetical protein
VDADGPSGPDPSIAAAEAAFDAGSTNEAVIAAYGAARAALLSTLPTRRARTHRQFLEDCLAAGVGRDTIETLTEVYERARYGGGAVTTSDAEAALAAARSLIDSSPEESTDG